MKKLPRFQSFNSLLLRVLILQSFSLKSKDDAAKKMGFNPWPNGGGDLVWVVQWWQLGGAMVEIG